MPKGPQGQKRPADVIGGAIKVAKIATGEEDEDATVSEKRRKAAVVRSKKLSPTERQKIAREAAEARWKKERDKAD